MTHEPTFGTTVGTARPDDPVDATVDLLGSRRRRRVLSALTGRTQRVALDDLAAELAAREAGDTGGPTGRDRLSTNLHHVHLPKLDDAGLVTYDADDRVVAGTGTLRSVADHLAGDRGE